ncbi:MAG TPA: HK97 gp10 family phage protein [Planctomycetota bacterium]|nr:HK97 gp10 family phage protein [Planctomycetota bacterium]
MAEAIRVEGLSEFARNLKSIDAELPKMLRVALNDVADLVVDDATPRIPRRSGRAARSVRARSTRTAVRIVGGGARVPYYPWLDFGGRVGRGGSIRRPFLKDGRYIYDSYYRNKPRFAELLEAKLIDTARAAGVEVDP